jgi:D-alanyl-D-alanine carboxypeptidase
MLSHPGKPVKMYSAAGIIGKPFSKPFSKPNVQKGIHVTGIYLLNQNIFDKDENTAKSASMAELQILKDNEINTNGFVFNDGSGLSRRNLITAEGLTNLIIKAIESPFANDFINSLSIAGYDGTLQKRMLNTFAAGNVRAKTGTLSNVSSLTGIVNNRRDDTIIFGFIFNGGSVGTYKKIENEISILLSER